MTLAALLKDPIVSSLLSLDASVRGNMVAACFSGMSPKTFWDLGGVSTFTVDFSSYSTIERHFFSTVQDRTESPDGFDRRTVLYVVKHPYFDDMEVTVKVIFIKANASTMKPYDIHLDVDMLALNRLGLYINTSNRDILTRVPVPVGILIQNCEDKKFAVLTSVENDVIVLEKQKQLKRLGFSLRQTRVEQGSAAPQGEKCSICLLDFESPSEGVAATVKTSCGHHFHRDCWEKHVEHSIQSGMNQLPGIFSFANSSFSDQRAGSIFVHCPLCRESFRAYEVTV